MCEIIGRIENETRRQFIKKAGLTAAALSGAAALGGGVARADTPSTTPQITPEQAGDYPLRLVLLGTAGGPTWWSGTDRCGIASAVVVEGAVYLVDCGDGFGRRYQEAGLFHRPGPVNDFTQLRGVFLTHLHSDHVVDFPSLMLFGVGADALGQPGRPVRVYGPGRRGKLPAVYPPGRKVGPPIAKQNPYPGTTDMTELLWQAFATDLNDRTRDTASTDPRTRLIAHDIPLPAGARKHPNTVHAPRLAQPIEVYQDELVKVTATLVDHGQVFPSFGYRFDTEHGSITFSGDTTVCDNLITLAAGTDILVHEVVDEQWVADSVKVLPAELRAPAEQHLLGAHTTMAQVGQVATDAGAKTLVLSHYGPGNNPRERWQQARGSYTGTFIPGEDLMQFGLGTPAGG